MKHGFAEKELEKKFREVQKRVYRQFKKNPDIIALLFLIGMREYGHLKDSWTKEEKQDLIHIAICILLEPLGYYKFYGFDQDGWPHFTRYRQLPRMTLETQDNLLKRQIIHYFEREKLFEQ